MVATLADKKYIVLVNRGLAAALACVGVKRTAAIAAWVQSLFREADAVPVLVGGAAVELYTNGAYTTGDFDFVGHVPRYVERIFSGSGFDKRGRHWIHEEAELFLEFPGTSLTPGEERVRFQMGEIEISVIGLEDLLVDRLGAWQYWHPS